MKVFLKKQRGFTLLELLIYTALLGIVAVVISGIFLQIINVTSGSRRARERLDNAERALDVITQEVRHADSIYDPTSVLGTSPGQLSLETVRDLPTDEISTYVDFYVDDGALYIKREGQTESLVTSTKVVVEDLTFSLIGPASKPTVKVSITVNNKDAFSARDTTTTLESTASLRSY